MCWTPNVFSWYWQTLQSLNRFDRLIVFQRITPTPNNSTLTLVCVCLTFTLTLSASVRAKKNDFSAVSFPKLLLRLCPTRCFTVSVFFFFFAFITFHLDFVWHCYSWTLRLFMHSQHCSLGSELGVCTFELRQFPRCYLLLTCCYTWRDSTVKNVTPHFFFPCQCSLWIMHFILAVYPDAVLVFSPLQNDWSQ